MRGRIGTVQVSEIPYRNPETNNLQDRRAEYETKVDVDQKEGV
jgi:hypothetical protein